MCHGAAAVQCWAMTALTIAQNVFDAMVRLGNEHTLLLVHTLALGDINIVPQ